MTREGSDARADRTVAALGAGVCGLGVLARAWDIAGPFAHLLDSAFQEGLALQHLTTPFGESRGLAVVAQWNGDILHHAAHPPLIHLLYAALYAMFGAHEWVSRTVSLLAGMGTAVIVGLILAREHSRRAGWAAAAIISLLPLAVFYSRTTNYEPVAVVCIAALYWAWTRVRTDSTRSILALFAVAALGGLWEWTTYLAIPALLIVTYARTRSVSACMPVVFTGIVAAFVLGSLLAWQRDTLGHIPMFTHAGTRSNWAAVTDGTAWTTVADTLLRGAAPALALTAAWLMWRILRPPARDVRDTAAARKTGSYLFAYFLLVCVLFFMTAPQLVLTHPLALYYLVPPLGVGAALFIDRLPATPAVVILLLACAVMGALVGRELPRRYPFWMNVSTYIAARAEPDAVVYSSAAVGYFNFYHGLTTLYPVGGGEPPLGDLVRNRAVDFVVLDRANPEVRYLTPASPTARQVAGYRLVLRTPTLSAWERQPGSAGDTGPQVAYTFTHALEEAVARRSETAGPYDPAWSAPRADLLAAAGEVKYGFWQLPADPTEVRVTFPDILIPAGAMVRAEIAIDPDAYGRAGFDNATARIYIGGENSPAVEVAAIRAKTWEPLACDLAPWAGRNVAITFAVHPGESFAYDRVFWGEPRIVMSEDAE